MIPVMPLIGQAASLMAPGAPGAEKSGPGFAETLRSESAALDRAARGENEAPPRTVDGMRQEHEAADKPANPAQPASVTGEAGEGRFAAGEGAPGTGQRKDAGEEDLNEQGKVDQARSLAQWLLLPQAILPQAVTAPVAGAGGELIGQEISRLAGGFSGGEETRVRFTRAGFGGAGESAGAIDGLTAPAAPGSQGETRVSESPVTVDVRLTAAGAEVAGQTPLRPVAGELQGSRVNVEPSGRPGIEVSPPPVGDPDNSRRPLGPEIFGRPAEADPVVLIQAGNPALLSQVADPLPGRPATIPALPDQVITPPPLPKVAMPLALNRLTNPVVVEQPANLLVGDQAAAVAPVNPAAVSVVVDQLVSPLPVSGAADSAVIISTLRPERPGQAPVDNSPAADLTRSLAAGFQTTVTGAPDPLNAESDPQQFADFGQPLSDEVEQFSRPGDSARAEFSTLLTGADNQITAGAARKFVPAPAVAGDPAMPVMDGRIVDQVVRRVSLANTGGETSLAMTLHPKELGEIRVELVSGKDGLRAHLHSQTQMVQEALERHLPRLREAFEAQGVKLSELQVSCDGRRDGGNAAFQQREQGQAPQTGHYRLAEARGVTPPAEWQGDLGVGTSGWSSGPGFSLRV